MHELDGLGHRKITRQLHAEGIKIAASHVRKIVEYKRRASVVRRWKMIDDYTNEEGQEGRPTEG